METKKIMYYVLAVLLSFSLFSCAVSQEVIKERNYRDGMTSLLNDYTDAMISFTDATVNMGTDDAAIAQYKEECRQLITATKETNKEIARLSPPEKYQKVQELIMNAAANAEKATEHLQKYIDSDDALEMADEFLAFLDFFQQTADYFALAGEELDKVK